MRLLHIELKLHARHFLTNRGEISLVIIFPTISSMKPPASMEVCDRRQKTYQSHKREHQKPRTDSLSVTQNTVMSVFTRRLGRHHQARTDDQYHWNVEIRSKAGQPGSTFQPDKRCNLIQFRVRSSDMSFI